MIQGDGERTADNSSRLRRLAGSLSSKKGI
jgi:hypothetical protein